MLRDKGLILLFLLAPAMLLVPFLHGDDDQPVSHARIVRLSYVDGNVKVSRQQAGGGYQNATTNIPLVQGDQVRTGDDGWAEIQLENGSTIRLAPESQITFALMTRFPSGATGTEVNLDDGEAEFAIAAGDEDGPFRVNVRQRVISLKHSSRFRVTTSNSNPLELVVWKGEIGLFTPANGQDLSIKKHEIFTLDPLDANHYDLERDAKTDDLDTWASQRDEYLQAFAGNSRTNYTQSPYQYGLSDLNYYGQYYNVPGCGYCWQPYGVNVGWDPFMNGYWYGGTWVSAYPWGWMPYRFGQWTFAPGWGWLWQPGLWNRWAFVPPVFNPPVGFRSPVPPHVSAAGGSSALGNKFDGGPAHLTMNNPALSTTTDNADRPVISNEHTPVKGMGDAGNSLVSNTNKTGQQASVTTNNGQPVLHVHPPVETRPMGASQPRAVHTPPPVIPVSRPQPTVQQRAFTPPPSPMVSRPQTLSPPPRSYTPPPQSYSPPPSAPAAAHSGPRR